MELINFFPEFFFGGEEIGLNVTELIGYLMGREEALAKSMVLVTQKVFGFKVN